MEKSKRIIFWVFIGLLIMASVGVITKITLNSQNTLLYANISASDWKTGNQQSTITLIEYSDFQCPACAQYAELVNAIVGEFGGHILFAYRYFPLRTIHPNAQLSAQAAEAAGLQGKFFEMHDVLFANQSKWAKQPADQVTNLFTLYAQELKLDLAKFVADINSQKVIDKVNKDYDSAINAGLNSTPTFFLNGVKIRNPRGLEEFRSLIRTTIEKNNT